MADSIINKDNLAKQILTEPEKTVDNVLKYLNSDSYYAYLRYQDEGFIDAIVKLKTDREILLGMAKEEPDTAHKMITLCLDGYFQWNMQKLYNPDGSVDMSKLVYDPHTNEYLYCV